MSTHPHNKHKALSRDLSIWIDTYDDLFSDFDPRPFTERAISDDFITELNKLTAERSEFIRTLHFQIPQKVREEKQEKIIIERLPHDFRREFRFFSSELTMNLTRGIIMTVAGILLLMGAVLIANIELQKMWHNLLLVVLQPAGWFLLWTGMDKMAFGGKAVRRKKEFYERLAKCKVEFVSI